VLGVLVISGEYSTGMIKSTLAAVPTRLPVLWAKALVLFVGTTVVGLITVFLVFAVTAPVRLSRGVDANLADPALVMALVGGAVYLGLVAVFALGVGTVVRSSAGGIAVALGVMLVLPVLVQMLGSVAEWARGIMPNLLNNAGQAMFAIPQELPSGVEAGPGAALPPGPAALVVLAWAAVALLLAAVSLRRRDV
jgi:ABC-2 type transport system permease protein